jgi:hypothetical protein
LILQESIRTKKTVINTRTPKTTHVDTYVEKQDERGTYTKNCKKKNNLVPCQTRTGDLGIPTLGAVMVLYETHVITNYTKETVKQLVIVLNYVDLRK